MCLGIPMAVIHREGNQAVVESGGIRKNIRVDLLDEVEEGDYVLVHTGFAIEKVDTEEARETLDLIKEVYRAGQQTREG